MSGATLTATDRDGARVLTVDCKHGTTTLAYANGADPDALQVTDTFAARLALAKHFDTEGCRCTRELRRRYGVSAV